MLLIKRVNCGGDKNRKMIVGKGGFSRCGYVVDVAGGGVVFVAVVVVMQSSAHGPFVRLQIPCEVGTRATLVKTTGTNFLHLSSSFTNRYKQRSHRRTAVLRMCLSALDRLCVRLFTSSLCHLPQSFTCRLKDHSNLNANL